MGETGVMSLFHRRAGGATTALTVVFALTMASCSSGRVDETSVEPLTTKAVTTVAAQQAPTTSTQETPPTAPATTTTEVPLVVVPDLTGETGAYARGVLDTLGLTLYAEESTEVLGEPDVIVAQLPQPGTAVTVGSLVVVTVPAPAIRLPTLGLSTAARQLLDETDDLKAGHAATIRAAKILEQDPDITHNPFGVIVKFEDGRTEDEISNSLTSIGGTRVGKPLGFDSLFLVETLAEPAEAVVSLQAEDAVEVAGLDYVIHTTQFTNDPFVDDQWGLVETPGVNASGAWNTATGTATVVVAVIDTGIQLNHPDLAASIWINPGEIANNGIDDDDNGYVDDINGWDFWNWDNNPDDDDIDGHGTHIAGTIGAVTNNGIGVAGIAPNVRLMALKVFNADGVAYSNDFYLALEYALANGAHVSNNSWGGYGEHPAMEALIDAAGQVGHIFVTAAGNEETNTDITPHYPSAYQSDNLISVGALDQSGQMASFSNYGRTSVDVAAPGRDIFSTVNNGSYDWMSGTSMAAPHVTGVVALLRSIEPNLIPSAIREILIDTSQPDSRLRNLTISEGTVDAAAAVRAITQSLVPTTTVPTPAPTTTSPPTPTAPSPTTTTPPTVLDPPFTEVFPIGNTPSNMVSDGTDIWVSYWGLSVGKIRSSDGTVAAIYPVEKVPSGLAFDGTHVWVAETGLSADIGPDTVAKLRISDGVRVGTYPVGDLPTAILFDGTHIWVANMADNTVSKLRASDGVRVGTYPVGEHPVELLFDGTHIWVANRQDLSVSKLRASDGAIVGTFEVLEQVQSSGWEIVDLAFDGKHLWIVGIGRYGGEYEYLWRLQIDDNSIVTVPLDGSARGLAIEFDGTHMWVLRRDYTKSDFPFSFSRVCVSDTSLVEVFPAPDEPFNLMFDGMDLWSTSFSNDTVTRRPIPDAESQCGSPPTTTTTTTTSTTPPQTTVAAPCGYAGSVVGTYPVGSTPNDVVFDGTHIWVTNLLDDTVSKLRASDGSLVGTYPAGDWPLADATVDAVFDGTHIWITTQRGTVSKLRASDGALVGTYPAASVLTGSAYDGTHIWVTSNRGTVSKLRASDGALVGTYPVGNSPSDVVFDGTHIWVTNLLDATVSKLRASDGALVGTYPVGNSPRDVVFDGTHIWVPNGSNTVSRLRASDGYFVGTYAAGGIPVDAVFDGTHIWVTNVLDDTVSKLRAFDSPC